MNAAPQKRSWPGWAALFFWLLIFLVITGDSVRRLYKHDTTPAYLNAVEKWWRGQDPYSHDSHTGFFYFPQAAVLFTPFTWGPPALGEILWRTVVFGLYAYALMRLARFFLCDGKMPSSATYLALSLLAVPSSMASLRNAQFDLPVATLSLLAAAEIATDRWKAAAAWLCLALALKPLAAVPILLFCALYGKLIPRVALGLVVVAALPFLHWNPSFVAREYARCLEALRWASQGDEPRYSDLAALISHAGLYPSYAMKTAARIVFALAYLGLGFAAVRRLDRAGAAWTIGALSADYLMLFNPRTETCSYVFLGPFVASLAILYSRQPARIWLGRVLAVAAVLLACDAFPKINDTLDFHVLTDRWLKPLIALLFLPVLIEFIFGRKKPVDHAAADSAMPASTVAV
ncbi:MAG TPA: glycosyltransferase 87 family protein [Candidatus Methylacidiphilales bacterium]|nr:glycosyltransferase 87 family protein [Candidatus Methylacidiphilales bacterium]